MSLVFIGVLVAIGVGVGASLFHFPDTTTATILGCIWGMIIGWIFNERLANVFGRYPVGIFGKTMKIIIGLLWGGVVGMYLSYTIVGAIISGRVKPLDPVSMGLFVVPVGAVFFTLVIMGYAYVGRELINRLRKGK
jgi:hypothetical protein